MKDPVLAIAGALEASGIAYAFTGAFALAYWGSPRGSQDLDVVIEVDGRIRLAKLLNDLRDRGLELDPVAALGEFDRFQVATAYVALDQGRVPVELILAVGSHGHRSVSRSVKQPYRDRPGGIPIVASEDFVVFKLIFFRPDGQDQADVVEVLRQQKGIDTAYILASLGELYRPDEERMVWLRRAIAQRGDSSPVSEHPPRTP